MSEYVLAGEAVIKAPDEQLWLRTGEAALLCSVQPDTIQKWIRSGKLTAQRTAGGHYRIAWRELEPLATTSRRERWYSAPPAQCRPQPLRCWERRADDGVVPEECRKCVVYRVRATWCFEVLGSKSGLGREYCKSRESCLECPYFQEVVATSAPILLVTQDSPLIDDLRAQVWDRVRLLFARNGYEAGVMVGIWQPKLVVADVEGLAAEPGVLQSLLDEKRVPGLRIALYGDATDRYAGLRDNERVAGHLTKPLQVRELAALLADILRKPLRCGEHD